MLAETGLNMFVGRLHRILYRIVKKLRWILILTLILTPLFLLLLVRRNSEITGHNEDIINMLQLPPQQSFFSMGTNLSETTGLIESRFQQRREHLKKTCAEISHYYIAQNAESAVKDHLIYNKEREIVYCSIEKVGCTFWKRVFQILSGHKKVNNPFHIKALLAYEGYNTVRGLPFDVIHNILRQSSKFIFVREPYERLLSGYVDKLFAPNAAYWSFIGRYTLTKFRPHASNFTRNCGHDVTFEEFVMYFIYSQRKNEQRDAHFVPNFEHCRPCELDYEYIGKMETFKEDTFHIMKILKLDKIVQFTNFQDETEMDAILDAVDYVYTMKQSILKCITMEEALARVWRKLQIRGLLSKHVEFPDSLKSNDITIAKVKAEMLKWYRQSGSTAERKIQRTEAFVEAYSKLPNELLNRLRRAVFVDAKLFGYDQSPNISQVPHSKFKYFSFTP